MKCTLRNPKHWIAICALLAVFMHKSVAFADEAYLAIHNSDVYFSHPLAEISRFVFEGNTMVVRSDEVPYSFALDTIHWIDFLAPTLVTVDNPEEVSTQSRASYLFPNRPNPFSPETKIAFHLPQSGNVELKIYDVGGRLIKVLLDGHITDGPHAVSWSGCDDAGRRVAAGVYLYNLRAPGIQESRRMVLLQR